MCESTATRPITDTAQFRYKYLHYGRTQLKIKSLMRGKHWMKTTLMPGSKQTNKVIIIIII
jgi:hypothetical protein